MLQSGCSEIPNNHSGQNIIALLYIKLQTFRTGNANSSVAYLLIPTSNHNGGSLIPDIALLYIFWLLHQTTTADGFDISKPSCISFDSYIKPQLGLHSLLHIGSCISFDSYIKPQLPSYNPTNRRVVYLLTPTSNHNSILFLNFGAKLYIFWLLHQTTTVMQNIFVYSCCISFDSYIKPQPLALHYECTLVVYLLTPTSNHNSFLFYRFYSRLYIFWLLHQTTTQ